MTEEKTLEEVVFDLLKRDFRITFYPVMNVNIEQKMEYVLVKLVKRNHTITRMIEKDHLVHGLLYWAEELNNVYEFECQHQIER